MMPRLLAFCLATLALFSLMPGQASAQWLPRGSYLESCRNVQQNGGWLSASCTDVRGRWVNSSLALDRCPRGSDVSNENGRLACGRGGSGSATRRPPPGSYMESCRNASMAGGVLQATCRNVNGRWVQTSIDARRCRGDIANFNGRLACR